VLVIVTIIFVLIAIIIPQVAKSREVARRAVCMSNLHQLVLGYQMYANNHVGRPVPANTSLTGGKFWAELLYPYSTRSSVSGSGQQLLMNAICPSAVEPAYNVGTATKSWGPYNQLVGGLNVRDQYGSYALNGNLYSNNPPPPMVSSLTANVGVIASTINTSGNHSVIGDAIVTSGVGIPGNLILGSGATKVTGKAYIWNNATVQRPGNVGSIYYADPNIPADVVRMRTPDVWGFYNTYSAAANISYASVPAVLDFATYPVIRITGDADLYNITAAKVTGAGILVVDGNVVNLPFKTNTPAPAFNIICKGDVDVKNGTLAGTIYCVGDVDGNGGGTIYGNIVTLGTYGGNGGPDVVATAFPSWDTTYLQPGAVNTLDAYNVANNFTMIPAFADSIWAEAWPTTTDLLPNDTSKGTMNSGLGRYYIKRHSQGIDVGFLDGHTEYVELPKLRGLKWSQQF
jgi:prepilin-type processing-associated H-X9-DG protein